jgi:hypothetical protein
MAKMYTDLSIKKLKPHRTKRLELPDLGAQGLYVCVQPSGAKSFAMRFRRPDGRNASLVLGGFDPTPRDPHPQRVADHLAPAGLDDVDGVFLQRVAEGVVDGDKNQESVPVFTPFWPSVPELPSETGLLRRLFGALGPQ